MLSAFQQKVVFIDVHHNLQPGYFSQHEPWPSNRDAVAIGTQHV